MKKIILLALILGQLFVSSCRKTTEISSTHTYIPQKSVCLGVDYDGTILLRAWGSGYNKAEAVEHAKKNAIYEVIFEGITNGSTKIDPLLYEVNAKEKYGYYVTSFFQDKGEYRKYVTESKSKRDSDIKASNDFQDKYGIIIEVNRQALKNRLINDGILKP